MKNLEKDLMKNVLHDSIVEEDKRLEDKRLEEEEVKQKEEIEVKKVKKVNIELRDGSFLEVTDDEYALIEDYETSKK